MHTKLTPFCSYWNLLSLINLEHATIETSTAQKMKFSIKDFFSKYDQTRPPFSADLAIFSEEILNGKLHFCAVFYAFFNVEKLQS